MYRLFNFQTHLGMLANCCTPSSAPELAYEINALLVECQLTQDADSAAQQGGALPPPPQQVQQQPAQQQAQQTPQPQMGAASGGLPNELLLDTLDTNVWVSSMP